MDNHIAPVAPHAVSSHDPLLENDGAAHPSKTADVLQDAPGRHREWRPFLLRTRGLILIIVLEMIVIAGVTALDALSRKHNGIAFVTNTKSMTFTYRILSQLQWSQSLLWTSLPVLLFTGFKFLWKSLVSAFMKRQPFVELSKARGGPPEKTILLDYPEIPTPWRWLRAYRNGHVLLAVCMKLSLVYSSAVVPLTATLFTPAAVPFSTAVPLLYNTIFDDTAFGSRTDLTPILDIVSATRIYGGSLPPWIDNEYAFQTFHSADIPGTDDRIEKSNITAMDTAYSAYLICVTVLPADYTQSFTSKTESDGTLSISANDRGCNISRRLTVAQSTKTYLQTWSTINCDPVYGYSRVSMLAAQYDADSATKLSNFSLVSCIPQYWTTRGNLTVSTGFADSPIISSFSPQASNESQIVSESLRGSFEPALHLGSVIDPTSTFSMNDYGRIIYAYAEKLNSVSPLLPEVLTQSISELFNTIFSVLCTAVLFQPVSEPITLSGTRHMQTTRLFVVAWVAYTVIAVFVIMLVSTILIFIHAYKHKSCLYEKPVGLLSYSGILAQSDLNKLVIENRCRDNYDGRLTERIEKRYQLEGARCRFEDDNLPTIARVVIEDLMERKGWEKMPDRKWWQRT